MNLKEIKNNSLGERYFICEHPSGLTIYLYPKEGYKSSYAIFGTKFGSINTKFKHKNSDNVITVPDGIAHYLEHKLFESEDGDAFAQYAKTGASANAYTSFDSTCYLFSCSENFEKSLEILLNFVQSPYFTEKNVQKERGIISQEIRMYDDDPGWRVMFNLLQAMYHNHPVRVDVAGTVESISNINPENLYECYNSFYNLKNMALCIAGNVDPEKVIEIADKILKPTDTEIPKTIFPEEPFNVLKEKVEQSFEVSMPMFQLGFKEEDKERLSAKQLAETEILLHVLASKSSPLYNKLLNENLINETFGYEYFEGPGYAAVIFSGDSSDPDKVSEIIKQAIKELHSNKVSEEDFLRSKKAIYGRNISILNNADTIANIFLNLHFAHRELFSYFDSIANATLEDINRRLDEQLCVDNSSISIVWPIKKEENK